MSETPPTITEIYAILRDMAKANAADRAIAKAEIAEIRAIQKANSEANIADRAIAKAEIAEIRAIQKESSKEIFGIGGTAGAIFEEEVADVVKRCHKDLFGMTFKYVTPDVRPPNGNQYDIVGTNGRYIVLMESKQTLRMDDINDLIERKLPEFKRDFPAYVKGKSVKGALLYRLLGGRKKDQKIKIAKAAMARGITLIRVVGNNTLHPVKTLKDITLPARHFHPKPKNPTNPKK